TISEAEIPHPAALKMSDSMRRTESKAEYGIARRTAADFLRKVKTCRPAPAPPVGANVASQKDDKRRFVL
ncbi:hypothetical protein MJO29_012221, partial [Puccinia striiformis f. sp. tritici]